MTSFDPSRAWDAHVDAEERAANAEIAWWRDHGDKVATVAAGMLGNTQTLLTNEDLIKSAAKVVSIIVDNATDDNGEWWHRKATKGIDLATLERMTDALSNAAFECGDFRRSAGATDDEGNPLSYEDLSKKMLKVRNDLITYVLTGRNAAPDPEVAKLKADVEKLKRRFINLRTAMSNEIDPPRG